MGTGNFRGTRGGGQTVKIGKPLEHESECDVRLLG